jgi:hypothetical protein
MAAEIIKQKSRYAYIFNLVYRTFNNGLSNTSDDTNASY